MALCCWPKLWKLCNPRYVTMITLVANPSLHDKGSLITVHYRIQALHLLLSRPNCSSTVQISIIPVSQFYSRNCVWKAFACASHPIKIWFRCWKNPIWHLEPACLAIQEKKKKDYISGNPPHKLVWSSFLYPLSLSTFTQSDQNGVANASIGIRTSMSTSHICCKKLSMLCHTWISDFSFQSYSLARRFYKLYSSFSLDTVLQRQASFQRSTWR